MPKKRRNQNEPQTEREEYAYWIDLFSKANGYSGEFNYKTAQDKAIVERSVVEEWGNSLSEQLQIELGSVKQNEDDPPDFLILHEKEQLSLELTQLISGNHKSRAHQGENPYRGKLFSDMQWSETRFKHEVQAVIDAKGKKYRARELTIDCLLIFTGEPYLVFREANMWMNRIQIHEHSHIRSAFLLLSYDPGSGFSNWPLMTLYGEDILRESA